MQGVPYSGQPYAPFLSPVSLLTPATLIETVGPRSPVSCEGKHDSQSLITYSLKDSLVVSRLPELHSRKLTWQPKKDPIKTAVPLNGDYMGFHVSLVECRFLCFPEFPVPVKSKPSANSTSPFPRPAPLRMHSTHELSRTKQSLPSSSQTTYEAYAVYTSTSSEELSDCRRNCT